MFRFRCGTFLLLLSVAAVSRSEAQQVGGWVSANGTFAQPAATSTTQVSVFPLRQEQFEATHVYTEKNKPSFDIGGGISFGQFGIGLAATRYSDTQPVNASISVPNRYFFDAPATASAITQNGLKHEETVLHIEGRYMVNLPHASIAVFAGPSYFKTAQEIVSNDTFSETYNDFLGTDAVSITGYNSKMVDLRAWGYNLGVDGAYYFSERIGVGGLLRFSRATVKFPNPIQTVQTGVTTEQSVDVGGLHVGAGIRFRF